MSYHLLVHEFGLATLVLSLMTFGVIVIVFQMLSYYKGEDAGYRKGLEEAENEMRRVNGAICWRDAETGGMRVRLPYGTTSAQAMDWAKQFNSIELLEKQEQSLNRLLSKPKSN
jgi:hypothetical protein